MPFLYLPFWRPDSLRIPLPGGLPESWPHELEVHPFGVLVALAVLVGAQIGTARAKREGIHPRVMGEMIGYMFIAAFVLGHMLDAVFYHWDLVVQRPVFVLELWNGLSSFGGFVGAFVGGVIWSLHRRMPLLPFADVCAYSFPFGWLFGRLGCSVAHDHPGRVTDFFLAVEDYEIPGMTPPWQVRHDLGIYEAMWCLAMIPLFYWLGRTPKPRGFFMAILPLLYAPVRFGLDFLRATDIPGGDPRFWIGVTEDGGYGIVETQGFGLTPGHAGAILLFATGLAVSLRVFFGPPIAVPESAAWSGEASEVRGDVPVGEPEGPPAASHPSGETDRRGEDEE
ncbi:MAG: prolipoprotein diacylglyceryl transferase [Sandaracinaceae bacterium]